MFWFIIGTILEIALTGSTPAIVSAPVTFVTWALSGLKFYINLRDPWIHVCPTRMLPLYERGLNFCFCFIMFLDSQK